MIDFYLCDCSYAERQIEDENETKYMKWDDSEMRDEESEDKNNRREDMKSKKLEGREEEFEGEGFEIRINQSFTRTSPQERRVEIGEVDLYTSTEGK